MRSGFALALLCFLPAFAETQSHTPAIKAAAGDVYLRVGNRSIDKMKEIRCTVERYKGDWAWIHTRDGKEGWVKRSEVVPLDRAVDYFTQRIRKKSGESAWYQLRAAVWEERDELDLALGDITEAIRLNPSGSQLRNSRGSIYYEKKDYDRALIDYNAAIRLDPNDAFFWDNAGQARARNGEFDKAIQSCTKAIELDPKYPVAYSTRAWAWSQKKDFDRAIADYNEAIRLDPKDGAAYGSRGWARSQKRDFDRAITDYNEAIRLDPKLAHAYNGRAWLWATCPDGKFRNGNRAVQSAQRACELTEWENSNNIDTLAAAYAEAGDFANAVKYASRALEAATPNAPERKELAEHLKLFRAGKPVRD